MNNYLPINLTPSMTLANFLKDKICQTSYKKIRYRSFVGMYLLKALNL